jgi:hypothetical protein
LNIEGSECGSGTGTLKMTKIPAATGIWSGMLRSDLTGLESQLTVSLTQTASILNRNTNTAPFSLSSLKMTGLIEHAATGCILQVATTNPGLLGDIQGLEINLESNGSPGILLRGSLNPSTTSLQGTFSLNGTSCSGETGTFTLIRK